MPVFYCKTCGRRMRAAEEAIGKQGRCKSCNTPVIIPAADEPPPSFSPLGDESSALASDKAPSLPQHTAVATDSASSPATVNQPSTDARKRPSWIVLIGGGCLLTLVGVIGIGILGSFVFGSKAGHSSTASEGNTGDYVYRSDQERNSEYLQNVRKANSGGEIEWLGPAASNEEVKMRRNVEAQARKTRANSDYLKGVRDSWAPAPAR